MNQGKTIFAQVAAHLPKKEFDKYVRQHRGNYRAKSFSCWDQLLCMLFAQLTYRESLRDIEACLTSLGPKLYHMGIRGRVSRPTLARANKNRSWRIYERLGLELIAVARELYKDDSFGIDLKHTVYVFDSTTIDLCLSLFPWARFMDGKGGRKKGAVKLHTLFDLKGEIPSFIHISDGKLGDVASLDYLLIEPGAFYILDRGYHDFARLFRFTEAGAFFVTRPRSNTRFRRLQSLPCNRSDGILCDQIIVLENRNSRKAYPKKLRRIRYRDPETRRRLVFLTNNFQLPATTICELYRARWRIELFFKWIKQHLRIKRFYGNSDNAVRTQIWIAISAYVLVAIIKKRLQLDQSLYTILQILSVSLFEKTPMISAFQTQELSAELAQNPNQLDLL